METMTAQSPAIRPLDALWALSESQPKKVKIDCTMNVDLK